MKTAENGQHPKVAISLLVTSLAAVLVVTGALIFYRHERQRAFDDAYDKISSVATLKVAQIVAWREERLRDGKRGASDPLLQQLLTDFLSQPANALTRERLREHLRIIQAYEACQDIIVTEVDGRVLLTASGLKPTGTEESISSVTRTAVASKEPVLGELPPCQSRAEKVLDVATTVPCNGKKPLAVLLLRTDLNRDFYPLLQSWPIPSPTSITVLGHREGQRVLCLSHGLNKPCLNSETALELSETQRPLVQAALGGRGLFHGRNGCGVEVMADLKSVPGTPWLMVTEIDRSEVLVEAEEHGHFIAGLAVLGLITCSTLTALVFIRRQHHLYQSLYQAGQKQWLTDQALLDKAGQLARLNRFYVMLKAVGQVIVRAQTPQDLYAEACRMAVEQGGFRMAWVGVADADKQLVLPVASAGVTADYLERLALVLDENKPRGQGPTGQAFRSGKAVTIDDIGSDPCMGPWRDDALRLGYRSSATFPMTVEGKVVAALSLYGAEQNCFDQHEVQLLTEMCEDMALALEFMEQGKRRQAAEDELRKFFRAIEQSPVAIVITNLDGAIEYVNPKFLRVTGYTLEEVLGNNPSILKSGETSPAVYLDLWQTIKAGGDWHGEFHNRKKDGTLFWERATISPIFNESGEITNFLAIKEDITIQKSLEEQLAQSQKLETVGRLAGGVAHDFNNMLGVILGSTELALDQVKADDPVRIDLEEIRDAARRSAGLTRQLLAFARKQIANPQVLELNGTIESMLSMLQRLLGENISLVWRPGSGLWPVKVDPSQIDQILANLTVNARDALELNGLLTVETANVVLDETYCRNTPECNPGGRCLGNPESCPGDYVLLTVSDTGAGMDQETLAHVFEPFYTTKELGRGTGLGLSTIYGIVKQNHGHIVADSEAGVGTTFRIYLPRAAATATTIKPPAPPDQREPVPGNETVLLVEDESAILQLGERILRQSGYTVLTASQSEDALALVAAHPGPLHLLITDIVMPGMNGKELAKELLVIRPGIKILLMSGYTADVIACHGVLEPDLPFIEKPFSKQDLLLKVRQTLDS